VHDEDVLGFIENDETKEGNVDNRHEDISHPRICWPRDEWFQWFEEAELN